MKKLFLALAIAGALTACNNETDTKTGGDSLNHDSNGAMMSAPSTDTGNKMMTDTGMNKMSADTGMNKMMGDTTKMKRSK